MFAFIWQLLGIIQLGVGIIQSNIPLMILGAVMYLSGRIQYLIDIINKKDNIGNS